jgi:YD repeat-containing protein
LTPSLTPTETLIPTETFTPLPTATEVPLVIPLTIDFTYDALHRLKSATYSDGKNFSYMYDANGNTVETKEHVTVTAYTYDAANQLVTAQTDLTVWHYEYDGNGSLVKVLPNNDEAAGAKRYTYNTAGYLVKVEEHDGNAWNIQAEMTYNGLGVRMSTNSSGAETKYASDGQAPLITSSGDKATVVLYGLGPIAEKTDTWNYALSDGLNVPRQLTDADGATTLSIRYNPWGDPVEINGIGNFDASYIGMLTDAATGLIYVGNGQYYDPKTGRFLTRGVNPNSPNPYMPFNPIGGILAPLALTSIYFSRKKGKKSPWMAFIFLGVLFLAGCYCPIPGTPWSAPSTPAATTQTPSPVPSPTATSTPLPPTPTPTVTLCPTPSSITKVILAGGRGADVTNSSSAYANQKPLSPYSDWANSRGYQVVPINFPGTKVAQRDNIIGNMNQGESYIIIGHSAGADSAILTLNDSRTQVSSISATVLLDPSLTASGVGATGNQITSLYENIVGPKVLLAGTEAGMGQSYLTKYTDPKYRYGRSSNPNAQYNPLSDWSGYPDVTDHTAMAIDPFVSNVVITWLEGLGL